MENQKEPTDSVQASKLRNVLNAEIGNRQTKQQKLRSDLIAVDAEIAGLREAIHHLDKLAGL